ncbi:MAG: hypothetical protein M1282_02930 [Chloroflexi bacterium]|nr:hypothetical protein [Chloroflexota bacterium]
MTNQTESNQRSGGGKTLWVVIAIVAVLALAVISYFMFFRSSPQSRRTPRSQFVTTLSPQITYAAPMTFSAPILPGTSSPVTETPSAANTPTSTPILPTASATAAPANTAAVTTPAGKNVTLIGVKTWSSPCYAGPGDMYEVQYEVNGGVSLLVLGRSDNSSGTWLQVRATRQKDTCWVASQYVLLNGDINSLAQTYPNQAQLPASNLYQPLTGVTATRSGEQVTVSWTDVQVPFEFMQSANSTIYLAELWTCWDGQLVFTPMATSADHVTVTDQAGCAQPSHGRVYLSVKDGYVGPTEINWPSITPAAATASVTPTP